MTDFQNQKERLKTFLSSINLTNAAFEKSLGLSNGYINSMRKGLGYDKLEQISNLYTDLNMGWLLTGEGEMLKSNHNDAHSNNQSGGVNANYQGRFNDVHTSINENSGDIKKEYTRLKKENNSLKNEIEMLRETSLVPSVNFDFKGSPYYNVDFIGGFDLVLNDQTINPEYYINFKPYNSPGVMWCNVSGKSMEPEINNGDLIAIKEASISIEHLPYGEIYGIVTNDYRTIKRISKSSKEGFVKLIPTNQSPEFVSQDIPISIIQKVFLVIGSVKRF